VQTRQQKLDPLAWVTGYFKIFLKYFTQKLKISNLTQKYVKIYYHVDICLKNLPQNMACLKISQK
jgi:hypothetical protein